MNNNNEMICPLCEEGELRPVVYAENYRHGNGTVLVEGLEGCECPVCGGQPVLTEQIRRNQVRVADARRAVDGLLVSSEIRGLREYFGISQQDAALLFGGGANAFSKYERGEVFQSVAMDRLLRLVLANPFLLDDVKALAGMSVQQVDLSSSGYVTTSDFHVTNPSTHFDANFQRIVDQPWAPTERAA